MEFIDGYNHIIKTE